MIQEITFRPDFLIIPSAALENDKCTHADRIIYAAVYWFAKIRGPKCTATNAQIAQVARMGERIVSPSLRRLEKAGLIKSVYNGKAHVHRVEITCL